jgi:glycosyltransferase involved in cell wall biosynthesis
VRSLDLQAINIVLNNFINDSRVLKTTKSLLSMGIDIHVVCLHEVGLPEHETLENLKVHRIKLKTRSWSKLKVVQLFKYAEFVWRVLREYRKSQIYHCNDLSALPIGVLAKLMNRGSKVIYDAHEYEINDVPNQSRLSIKLKYFIERFFIQFADEVITVSDSIADAYKGLYGIDKPHLVLNCPVYKSPGPHDLFREKFNISSAQRIFLYQGGLAKGRGIEILLQAFEESDDTELVLVCMGYGPLEGLVQEKASASSNIYFHPAVSPEFLLDYTTSADFGILFYQDNCLNHKYCSPNKMFEYLMAGLPVIVSNLHEMRRLVKKHGIGSIANENTVEGFKVGIQNILCLDYEKLRQNVEMTNKLYCWEQQETVLKKVYAGLFEAGNG